MALSRRKLLTGTVVLAGGGLALTWLRPDPREAALPGAAGGFRPNAWLQITPDDQVILQVDKIEMGQGVMTGFVTLLSEELHLPPEHITTRIAPVHPLFQDPLQLTGGSESMRVRWLPLRETGARARQMLLDAAAARWQVDVDSLQTDGTGAVVNPATGAALRYGDLADDAALLPLPRKVTLRSPANFSRIGTDVPRPDIPAKVTGTASFGIDVRPAGVLVALVVRPPDLGGSVGDWDGTQARQLPGVIAVFPMHAGIAVVAENFWSAKRAAAAVTVTWQPGPLAGVSSASIRVEQGRQLAARRGHRVRNDGNVEAVLTASERRVEAEYWLPYLAHATLEPPGATIWFHDGVCEAWVSTQGPDLARQAICEIAGLRRDQVTVHATYAGGGFGRRATADYVLEAAAIAREVDRPVKLVWTREDDLRHGQYREATLHRLQGALDADGRIAGWHHRMVAASLNALVFPMMSGTVAPEWIPRPVMQGFSTTMVALFDRLVGSFSARMGATSVAYAIPNLTVDVVEWNPGVPVTIWRSVGHSYACFALECFMDELAAAALADPVEFRRRHLRDQPRHLRVLEVAADKAGWGRPPPGRFQGVAVQESFGTVVAEVAEISVAPDRTIRVHRVTCAVDCGLVVNPDIVRQQMEGGILFGLSAALYGEITLDGGAVRESNFHDYRQLRLAEAPEIDVHLVGGGDAPSGVGESGLPPIAPAVANAIFAATGQRSRTLPLRAG